MVGKGPSRFNTSASPKVRRYMPTTSTTKKKPSPKCNGAKKSGSSPRVKQRADWNPALERSLVEILHDFKDTGHRGDNGWNSEGWNQMVKEFHVRNKSVSYTKAQIQEKEGQLKRDYKMLKAARQQSGSRWNEKRDMVEGPPAMWENLMVTFPKIKKFNNAKASFPLFDDLGELYDGHLAEGTYNYTSLEEGHVEEASEQHEHAEDEPQGWDGNLVHEVEDEFCERSGGQRRTNVAVEDAEDEPQGRDVIPSRDEESDALPVERSGQRRSAAAPARNKHEKGDKRPRKSEKIEGVMERYIEMRQKQSEDETALWAREMEAREREARERGEREREAREREEREARERENAQVSDFSIRRCFSVLNTMEMTKEEKAKAYSFFTKNKDNREAFICACELDEEAALIWLRSEMS